MTLLDNDIAVWTDVCALDSLIAGRGRAALVNGDQVALFRLADDSLYAVSNFCPFSEANVISRGIVGSKGDAPKVASPIFKQTFDLRTGQCFEDGSVVLTTYPVRAVAGRVEIGSP